LRESGRVKGHGRHRRSRGIDVEDIGSRRGADRCRVDQVGQLSLGKAGRGFLMHMEVGRLAAGSLGHFSGVHNDCGDRSGSRRVRVDHRKRGCIARHRSFNIFERRIGARAQEESLVVLASANEEPEQDYTEENNNRAYDTASNSDGFVGAATRLRRSALTSDGCDRY